MAEKLAAAAALDHVAGDGPRRAGEADQGAALGQRRAHPAHRLQHRGDPRRIGGRRQRLERSLVAHRREPRPVALDVAQITSERPGQDQDVAVRIAASMPKRRTGCNVISVASVGGREQGQRVGDLRPQRPVFRQVAAGLPHQPHRRRVQTLAGEGSQQRLVHPRPLLSSKREKKNLGGEVKGAGRIGVHR